MADDDYHLARARAYHASYAWRQACDEFRAAGGPAGLGVEDVECFAECAQIVGFRDDAIAANGNLAHEGIVARSIEHADVGEHGRCVAADRLSVPLRTGG